MATFTIESNGRIEKTAVYFNGEQLGGIKEVFLNLDEEGTFDAILQYEGKDKEIYTKRIFEDYMTGLRTVEPTFTEEEAEELVALTIESDGDIESTAVLMNGEVLEGIVSLFVHLKGAENKNGIRNLFRNKTYIPEIPEFRAEITFRNEDNSLDMEAIF